MKDSALIRVFGLNEDGKFSKKGPRVEVYFRSVFSTFKRKFQINGILNEVLFVPLMSFEVIFLFETKRADDLERSVRCKLHILNYYKGR